MCLLRCLPFVLFVLYAVGPSARAAPIPEVSGTPNFATQVDVQCKMVWGNRVCQEVGKKSGGKKRNSGASKGENSHKQAGRKQGGGKKNSNTTTPAKTTEPAPPPSKQQGIEDVDDNPEGTLLLPYFECDLNKPGGCNTLNR